MKKNIQLIQEGDIYRFKYDLGNKRITSRGFNDIDGFIKVIKEEQLFGELN